MLDIIKEMENIEAILDINDINQVIEYSLEKEVKLIICVRELFHIFCGYWEPHSECDNIQSFLLELSEKMNVDAKRLWIIFIDAHILSLIEMECYKSGIKYHFKKEMFPIQ